MNIHLGVFVIVASLLPAWCDEGDRVISADLKQVQGPRSMVWQDCVGAGRVGEGLRDSWRRQLEECHADIGFTYLRMHGLLHDELGVYSEDAQGKPRYNWQDIDDVYDFLLSIRMKPFVEIGFMPNALASGNTKNFWWNANVTPPKDYAKWDALITALVQHWTDRYGVDEVKTWRFEIWNEPNHPRFWQPPIGVDRRDAYFELFKHTAKAVTAVNANYVVGGPAGAGPVWTKELIDFCGKNNVPIDFISYHCYGLTGGASGLDEDGNRLLYLSHNLHSVADRVVGQRRIIESTPKPQLPIYITEWSSSFSSRDPVHDSYFSAPYILEQLRRTESVNSMSYWTFTDIFEEVGPPPRPFHGGFGLINAQGIRKPAFWAYQFLSQLGPTEVRNSDHSSYVCTDGNGGAQVLLWDLTPLPGMGHMTNQDIFFKPHPTWSKGNVTVNLENLKPGNYRLEISQIGYRQNDPYSRYIEMGRPTDLSREAVEDLKKLSTGKPSTDTTLTVNGTFTKTLPLQGNSVYLLKLTPISSSPL